MRSFLSRLLHGDSSRLRPHEAGCFNALAEALPSEAAQTLREQLRAIDLVQRHSKDKLVTVYFSKPVALFPNREPELHVAQVLCASQAGAHVRADIVFHEGRLSSLEFRIPPNPVAKGRSSVQSVELRVDPSRPPAPAQLPSDGGEMPTLARIREHLKVSDVLPPALNSEIERFLSDVTGSFQSDYAALLQETNGFYSGTWRFLGTKARRIVLPDTTLVLVAEGNERALCFELGGQGGLLLYDQIDDETFQISDSFVDALVDVCQRG